MATHFRILAWKNPMDRGVWRAIVHGVTESDMTEHLSTHMYRSWVGALDSSSIDVSLCSQDHLSHLDISPIESLDKLSPRYLPNAINKRLQARTVWLFQPSQGCKGS